MDVNILLPSLPFEHRQFLLSTAVSYFNDPSINRGDTGETVSPAGALTALEKPTSLSLVGNDIHGRHLQVYFYTDDLKTIIELEITFFEPEQLDRELTDPENVDRLKALIELSDRFNSIAPGSPRYLCEGNYSPGSELLRF
ncbi:hypothetical protein [Parvularcula lutaonensis]|uniref:Uncharacterized protein n=2 Tax=Parvularcula lutaonensis TaxID=491923 RepID=A0ABV7M9J7_9PROT